MLACSSLLLHSKQGKVGLLIHRRSKCRPFISPFSAGKLYGIKCQFNDFNGYSKKVHSVLVSPASSIKRSLKEVEIGAVENVIKNNCKKLSYLINQLSAETHFLYIFSLVVEQNKH